MWWSRAILLASLAALASCGFQMRGATTVPPEMARTYIEAADNRSLFYRRLRDSLETAGVDVVDSEAAATATFSILSI